MGGPVYQPVPGYSWKLDVNIVKIEMEDMSISKGTTAGVGKMCGNLSTTSATTGVGMTAKAKVTITGPEIDGVQRGVKYMQAGFLQISTSRDEFNTTAARKSGAAGTITIAHHLQDADRYLDQITRSCTAALNTEWPWYDATGAEGRVGFFHGTSETQAVSLDFEIVDVPYVGLITDYFRYNFTDWIPTRTNIAWKFELNIAARTSDSDVISEEQDNFTQLATGNWKWDGDAIVNQAGNWAAIAPGAPGAPAVSVSANLASETGGNLIEWVKKEDNPANQPFNKYLDPWLIFAGGVWVPNGKHDVN